MWMRNVYSNGTMGGEGSMGERGHNGGGLRGYGEEIGIMRRNGEVGGNNGSVCMYVWLSGWEGMDGKGRSASRGEKNSGRNDTVNG